MQVNVNMAGLPALVVPSGFVEGGSAGLPVGLQMIGSPFSEVIMLLHRFSSFNQLSSTERIYWWSIFFTVGESAESRPHLWANAAGCQFCSTTVGRHVATLLRHLWCWFWASLELLCKHFLEFCGFEGPSIHRCSFEKCFTWGNWFCAMCNQPVDVSHGVSVLMNVSCGGW